MEYTECAGILADYQTGERWVVRQDLCDALDFMLHLFDEQAKVVALKKQRLDEYVEAVKKWQQAHADLTEKLKQSQQAISQLQDEHQRTVADLADYVERNATLEERVSTLEHQADEAVRKQQELHDAKSLLVRERFNLMNQLDGVTKHRDELSEQKDIVLAERNTAIETHAAFKKAALAQHENDKQVIEGMRKSLEEARGVADRRYLILAEIGELANKETI